LDKIEKRPQRRGHQAPTGVVEERSREGLPPGFEHWLERAAVEMRAQPILEQIDDAGTGNRCVYGELDPSTDADEQWSRGVDAYHLAVPLELPGRHRPAAEASAQAGMREQLARVLGPTASIEIGGRGSGREALRARPDRHRNHVLLQPLVVADA